MALPFKLQRYCRQSIVLIGLHSHCGHEAGEYYAVGGLARESRTNSVECWSPEKDHGIHRTFHKAGNEGNDGNLHPFI